MIRKQKLEEHLKQIQRDFFFQCEEIKKHSQKLQINIQSPIFFLLSCKIIPSMTYNELLNHQTDNISQKQTKKYENIPNIFYDAKYMQEIFIRELCASIPPPIMNQGLAKDQYFRKNQIVKQFMDEQQLIRLLKVFPSQWIEIRGIKQKNQLTCIFNSGDEIFEKTFFMKAASGDIQGISKNSMPDLLKQGKNVTLPTNEANKWNFDQFLEHYKYQRDIKPGYQKLRSNSRWTEQQLQKFIQLYLRYGSKWTCFTSQLKNKTYKQIKNKFSNSFKKISKILHHHEGFICKNTKKTIDAAMLRSLVDFVQQLQVSICQFGLTPNYQSNLFSFRQQFLKLSLIQESSQNKLSEINNLIRTIKFLNSKIKSFKLYRKKTQKKMRKITKISILSILEFDNIIMQDMRQIMLKLKIFSNKEEKFQKQQLVQISEDFEKDLKDLSLMEMQSFNNFYLHRQEYDLDIQYCDVVREPLFVLSQDFFQL